MSASPFRSDHTWYAQYMARERAGAELPSWSPVQPATPKTPGSSSPEA